MLFWALDCKILHMPIDYRARLAANIRQLLSGQGIGPKALRAKYLSGNKQGAFVSSRTIGYILSGNQEAGLDAIVAIACSLGVEPYHLLTPILDPLTHLQPEHRENWIKAEAIRRAKIIVGAERKSEARNEAQEIARRAAGSIRARGASLGRAGANASAGGGRPRASQTQAKTKRTKTTV